MTSRPMRYALSGGLVCAAVLTVLVAGLLRRDVLPEDVLAAYRPERIYPSLRIIYPLDEAVFPPDIAAATFRWEGGGAKADTWLVAIGPHGREVCLSPLTSSREWTPSDAQWDAIKEASLEKDLSVTVLGIRRSKPRQVLSAGRITIRTSKDEVGAPILYREIDLPYADAAADPTRARWRFGPVSCRQPPPVVLEKLPVCANCHSFSVDGPSIGMDVDHRAGRGAYAVASVAREVLLKKETLVNWRSPGNEDEPAFGLLSQLSPNGRYVVTTIESRSVLATGPKRAYSKLFFPVQGILGVYDRHSGTLRTLHGADDRRFVQTNPCWSPDGKYIVFARSAAYRPKQPGKAPLLSEEECRELFKDRRTFRFDLYRVPFNDGHGGEAKPLAGAADNGMSHYCPRYSPKGKWIVFCRAKNFMFLQPDSQLCIIPAAGGQARPMRCNTSRMNSWHSWSPNGRWLVFSSKANRPYTQLFLTHIDEEGHSSPPVVLERFTPHGAANIPEFVAAGPTAIRRIRQQFMDDASFFRAGSDLLQADRLGAAEDAYRNALRINPEHAGAHNGLGCILFRREKWAKAKAHLEKAIACRPAYADAHANLGRVLLQQGMVNEAVAEFHKALEIDSDCLTAHESLAGHLHGRGQIEQAIAHWRQVIRIEPRAYRTHRSLGEALTQQGAHEEAIGHLRKALAIRPNDPGALNHLAWELATCPVDGLRDGKRALELAERACESTNYTDPYMLDTLAATLAEQGQFDEAVAVAAKALELSKGLPQSLQRTIGEHLASYKDRKPWREPR